MFTALSLSLRKAIAIVGVVVVSGSPLLIVDSSARTRVAPKKQSAVESSERLTADEVEARNKAGVSFAKLPLAFEPNVGQTSDEVKYLARGKGYSVFVTPSEVVLSVGGVPAPPRQATKADLDEHEEATMRRDILRMSFVGANAAAEFTAGNLLPGRSNYLTGSDPTKWHTEVPNFERLRAEGVYDGVDVELYGIQQQLEYDFRVNPGADPNQIRVRFDGAETLAVNDDGDLVMHLGDGEIRQLRANAYQQDGSEKRSIGVRYAKRVDGEVGFDFGAYDPSSVLVVDPALIWSTYVGGNASDQANDVAVAHDGSVYFIGSSSSANFPVTNGAFDTSQNGNSDVVVSKLAATGDALAYSTFIGGPGDDQGKSIAIDNLGQAHIAGSASAGFPSTSGAFDTTHNGLLDAFVATLNSNGTDLVYATFLGGLMFVPDNSNDSANAVALDEAGNAYVTGYTETFAFPVTAGSFGTQFGGRQDLFITKLNATGSALYYSGIWGGGSSDVANGVAVDSMGQAYITGSTQAGCCSLENVVAFKLNALGSQFLYGIGLPGGMKDVGRSVAVDAAGSAYITGYTESPDFPVTDGAFDTAYNGNGDAFITKLGPSGTQLYSTFLGGDGFDSGAGVAVDASNWVYVVGETQSSSFPTTPDALDPSFAGGDAFLTVLGPLGSGLVYSTYLGGSSSDSGASVALADQGIYVIGTTYSSDFPTLSPYQANYAGEGDVFIARLNPVCSISCPETTVVEATQSNPCGAIVSYSPPVTAAACGTISCTPPPASFFQLGTTTVTCSTTVGTTCSFLVTVVDTTPPTLECPTDISVNAPAAQCSAVVTYTPPTATDGCSGALPTLCSPPSGSSFPIGVTTVNCAATDSGGNQASCGFAVTVADVSPPSITCPAPSSANAGANCQAAVPNVAATVTATDNCTATGALTITQSPLAGALVGLGPHTVTVTTTDASGNMGTCSTTFTVVDATPPTIDCPANIATTTAAGQCSTSVAFPPVTASDACSTPTVACLPPSGSIFPIGVTTITCTATDLAGNVSSCGFTVSVMDTQVPSISCPAAVSAIATSTAGVAVSFPAPVVTDNCLGSTVTCVPSSGSLFAIGSTPVTCTATDASSNLAQCSFAVNVVRPRDSAGIYFGTTGAWFLHDYNSSGAAESVFAYGPSPVNWVPVRGDWDGDGDDTAGLYDPVAGAFFLRNSNSPGPADHIVSFGPSNSTLIPIAGDWDGDGDDTVGLYNSATGAFFLRNINAPGPADVTVSYGPGGAGFKPVCGDWNGDGTDTLGVYSPTTGAFFLRNTNTPGAADVVFTYGPPGAIAVSGDWNSDGTDTIGIYVPTTGAWFLRDSNSPGSADYVFAYGPPNASPIVGNWDGSQM